MSDQWKTLLRSALLVMVVAACGTDAPADRGVSPTMRSSTMPSPPASATTITPSRDASPDVPEVLRFEAPLLGGGTFRGENLAGRDVAFWFWAPW